MKPGIHKDISIEDYHADKKIVSAGGVKLAKKSSRHFAYYLNHDGPQKSALSFGNAFETMLLDKIEGTNLFERDVVIYDIEDRPEKDKGITSKQNQEWKKQVHECGKYVIKKEGETESLEACKAMVQSVMAEPLIVELLSGVDYQNSFVWVDPITGVKCKTRPDVSMVRKKVMVDIKTTIDASPGGFARQCVNFDHLIQAIMQIEGALQSGYLDQVDEYFWLACEKVPPYNAVLYRMQPEDREMLRDHYELYLGRCANVLKEMEKHDNIYQFINGYNENADNKFGVLDLEIPLYYNR